MLLIVACIGAFTALLAALIALTQTRPEAGAGLFDDQPARLHVPGAGLRARATLAAFAVTAAIFHLFTHAFFKALLFLSAGSVMHAMGNVIDMRRFSGLRYALPVTHWTFLCGALALAGVPIFSGFWSKDEILGAAPGRHAWARTAASTSILLIAGLVTAGLTAFYTFRAYFLTFWGELKTPPEAGTVASRIAAGDALAVPRPGRRRRGSGPGRCSSRTGSTGLLDHHWLKRSAWPTEGGAPCQHYR